MGTVKPNFLGKLIGSKAFYKNLFVVALPIIIQNFITSSLNMVDTIMIGRIGESEIAAVGISNQYFFLFNLFVIGIYGGCSVFISQFYGKGDKENIKKVVGLGNVIGIGLSIIFTVVALFFSESIISIFNKDAMVIKLGSDYLKIVCLSYLFTAISFNYSAACRCVRKAMLPMILSILAIICNTVLNSILIFGMFGIDPMGVKGAALATLISRIIECTLLIIFIYTKKLCIATKLKNMLRYDMKFVGSIVRHMVPIVLNEACWGLGSIVYNIIYGRISIQAMASIQITTTIQNLFFVVFFGISSAATVIIGNKVGAGKESEALEDSFKIIFISVIIGLLVCICLSSTANTIVSFFNVSDVVKHSAKIILYVVSCILVIRVINITIIVGILRGGGDSSYALKVEAITMWVIGVPMAFIGAVLLKLPVEQVVALVTIEEVIKCIFSIRRIRSNSWVKSVVKHI